MAKYHIGKNLIPRRCYATKVECTLKGGHFDSLREANEFIKSLSKEEIEAWKKEEKKKTKLKRKVSNSKSDNRVVSDYHELLICKHLSGAGGSEIFEEKIEEISSRISSKNKEIIENYAKKAAKYISEKLIEDMIFYIKHTGQDEQNSSAGDIQVNDKTIELKFTERGFGTYYNSSINKTLDIIDDFPKYEVFLDENDFYTKLSELGIPEDRYNKNNASPFSRDKLKKEIIPETQKSVWETLKDDYGKFIEEIEEPIRKEFVKKLYNVLKEDPELVKKLSERLIGKGNKGTPDFLLIQSKVDGSIIHMTKEEMEKLETIEVTSTEKGIRLKGLGFISIGWQNGNGLSNPTIRFSFRKEDMDGEK